MERTITILGTIENCKKAESLISAKLRASYESDMSMNQLMQNTVSSLSKSLALSLPYMYTVALLSCVLNPILV